MVIIPAILESFRSLKDKGYKVLFESNELSPENMVGLNESLGEFGYLAFKKDAFKHSEKEMIDNLESDYEDKGKTPGQRLRAVLYRLYEQTPEGFTTFTLYYQAKMETLVEHFKSKLD